MADKKFFYGNEISNYGVQNGYVDYRTLSKCFDAVLNNEILAKTYEIGYWEQENGFIDNSDEIEQLQEKLEELENEILDTDENNEKELEELETQYRTIQGEIEDLENEQDYPPEVFQWYIISSAGAELLKKETNEIVYYNEELNMYLLGVTHYGTSWDYVLTDIKIDW